MSHRRLELLPSFEHAYVGLSIDIQKRVEEALVQFSEREADNSLRPELKNGFNIVWSI